jgi:multidrug transporter EmrE-like cation transporter
MAPEHDRDTSVASLIRGLLDDVRELFREEVALARAEIRQQISAARTTAILFAASAAALVLGLIFLLTALARGMAAALGWPVWLGFGVLGVVLAVLGGILLAGALARARHIHALPPQTIDSVKENVAWIKERTRSGGA